MSYVLSKSKRYIQSIRTHVILPLETTELSQSCYATCMMIFGGIDGLGKLLHPDANAKVNVRFRYFLSEWMCGPYYERQKLIWELRNNLDHNAIATLTFLSRLPDSVHEHLKTSNGTLFVNTKQFLTDFNAALQLTEDRLSADSALLVQSDNRLVEVFTSLSRWSDGMWETTPPGNVRFC